MSVVREAGEKAFRAANAAVQTGASPPNGDGLFRVRVAEQETLQEDHDDKYLVRRKDRARGDYAEEALVCEAAVQPENAHVTEPEHSLGGLPEEQVGTGGFLKNEEHLGGKLRPNEAARAAVIHSGDNWRVEHGLHQGSK